MAEHPCVPRSVLCVSVEFHFWYPMVPPAASMVRTGTTVKERLSRRSSRVGAFLRQASGCATNQGTRSLAIRESTESRRRSLVRYCSWRLSSKTGHEREFEALLRKAAEAAPSAPSTPEPAFDSTAWRLEHGMMDGTKCVAAHRDGNHPAAASGAPAKLLIHVRRSRRCIRPSAPALS